MAFSLPLMDRREPSGAHKQSGGSADDLCATSGHEAPSVGLGKAGESAIWGSPEVPGVRKPVQVLP
jgi:hypothetical protein